MATGKYYASFYASVPPHSIGFVFCSGISVGSPLLQLALSNSQSSCNKDNIYAQSDGNGSLSCATCLENTSDHDILINVWAAYKAASTNRLKLQIGAIKNISK